jgi:hypothetical protein
MIRVLIADVIEELEILFEFEQQIDDGDRIELVDIRETEHG